MDARNYLVYSDYEIIIQPFDVAAFSGRIIGKPEEKVDLFVYPKFKTKNQKSNLYMPVTLQDNSPHIFLKVFNAGEKPIKIYKDQIVASAVENNEMEQIPENKLQEINTISPSDTKDLIDTEIENLEFTDSTLSQEQKQKIKALLKEHKNLFSKHEMDIGKCPLYTHKLTLKDPNSKPIAMKYRAVPHHHTGIMKIIINRLLEAGIIRYSDSPWNSSVFLIPKKSLSKIDTSTATDEELADHFRPVFDYRSLNKLLECPFSTIENLNDMLHNLANSESFSKIDIANAFFCIELEENSKKYTAFSALSRHFEFNRMGFGLNSAPYGFSRAIATALGDLLGASCFSFFDDILLKGKDFTEHYDNLKAVLQRLKETGFKIKLSKCEFFIPEVEYLGFKISKHGILCHPDKISVVKRWKQPENVKELQSFLGMCGYLRQFIKDYAIICKPLFKLLKNDTPFSWTDQQENTFNELKNKIISAPILRLIDLSPTGGNIFLEVDASQNAISGVLLQEDESKKLHPVAYSSKCLSESQRNMCPYQLELYSIIFHLKKFKNYLQNQPFTVITDHLPLKSILETKNPSPYLVRQIDLLSQFTFTIQHKPGIKNSLADALSRTKICSNTRCSICPRLENKPTDDTKLSKPDNKDSEKNSNSKNQTNMNTDIIPDITAENFAMTRPKPTTMEVPRESLTKEEIIKNQNDDETLSYIKEIVASKIEITPENRKMLSPETNLLYDVRNKLKIIDNMLMYEATNDLNESVLVPVLPKNLINDIIDLSYSNLTTGGHAGYLPTLKRIQLLYFWPFQAKSVEQFVNHCLICQRGKKYFTRNKPQLHRFTPKEPFDCLAIDFMGPLKPDKDENKYIFVATCTFTKFVIAVPVQNIIAESTCDVLIEHVITKYKLPKHILSDNASNFLSTLVTHLCKLLSIRKYFTLSYCPFSNGCVERSNQTLTKIMLSFAHENPDSWGNFVHLAAWSYNSTYHSSIKMSPHLALFGTSPATPDIHYFTHCLDDEDKVPQYVENIQEKIVNIHKLVAKNSEESFKKSKKYYDKNTSSENFEPGTIVFIKELYTNPKEIKKFCFKWSKPYVVSRRLSNTTYEIKLYNTQNARPKIVHRSHMKKAYLWPNGKPISENGRTYIFHNAKTIPEIPENISQSTLPSQHDSHTAISQQNNREDIEIIDLPNNESFHCFNPFTTCEIPNCFSDFYATCGHCNQHLCYNHIDSYCKNGTHCK